MSSVDSISVVMVLFVMVIYLAMLAGLFVVTGLGLYKMAKHAGVPHSWLAFIPLGKGYIMGLLAERSLYTFTGKKRRLALWNILFPAGAALSVIFILVGILALGEDTALLWVVMLLFFATLVGSMVIMFYSLYYIFKDYAPDSVLLFFLLSLLLELSFVFLLVCMNNVPVSVTGYGPYPYGRPKYNKFHQWNPAPPNGYGPGPNGAGPFYPGQQGGNPGNYPPNQPPYGNPPTDPTNHTGPEL